MQEGKQCACLLRASPSHRLRRCEVKPRLPLRKPVGPNGPQKPVDVGIHDRAEIEFIAEDAGRWGRCSGVQAGSRDATPLTWSAARCARVDPRSTVSSSAIRRCQSHYAVLVWRKSHGSGRNPAGSRVRTWIRREESAGSCPGVWCSSPSNIPRSRLSQCCCDNWSLERDSPALEEALEGGQNPKIGGRMPLLFTLGRTFPRIPAEYLSDSPEPPLQTSLRVNP